MATITFLEAGTDETQDFTFWQLTETSGTGAISSATDQAHTGTRSIKCAIGSIGDQSYAATFDGVCTSAGSAISFWVRFSTIPTTRTPIMDIVTAGDGSSIFYVGIETNGKLLINSTTGSPTSPTSGTTVLSAGVWYRLCFAYTITSTTVYSMVLFLNGVSEVTLSNAGALGAGTATSDIEFGISTSSNPGFPSSGVCNIWYDDIYVDNRTDLTDPGAISVTAKRPFANGTTNGFTTQIGSGGSGYGTGHAPQVNELPLNTANGWSILVVASAITEEYNIEGLTVGDVNLTGATIKGVRGWIFAKSSLSETDQIIVDGTATNIATTSTNTLFTQNSPNITTYPAGTGTDIGMKTNTTAATASLYEAGILVAFIPGATTTNTSNFFNFFPY